MKKLISFDIGIINMAYCILDYSSHICHWNVFSLCNGTEIENTIDLMKKLDAHPEVLDVDVVLLEKQLHINPKMRVMAEAVRSYMIFRGLVDRQRTFKMINYSPKYKLNCYDGPMPPELIPVDVTNKSKMYRFRKKQSVYHCGQLIKDQSVEMIDFFARNKKKQDDLSDAYLQGLSYIMYEQNKKSSEVTTIIKRQPTKKQVKYKKYTKNNLKYLFCKSCMNDELTDIAEWINSKEIKKSIASIYGVDYNIEDIRRDLVPDHLVNSSDTGSNNADDLIPVGVGYDTLDNAAETQVLDSVKPQVLG